VGEDEQVDTLLDDLRKFYKREDVNQYLIGSVILCDESTDGEKAQPLLIDGQQRTLTFTLLLMCARKFLRVNKLVEGNNDRHTKLVQNILHCLNENPEGSYFPKVKMSRAGTDEILAELFDWSGIESQDLGNEIFKKADTENKSAANLRAVAKYIYDAFMSEEWLPKEDFIPAMEKILSGVKFIELTVTHKRESIAIFDRINDRGMQLTKADIVKNLIFQEVEDDEFDMISEKWNNMAQSLIETKKSRLQDPKYLLRALSHFRFGAHPGYDDLADFWESKFDQKDDGVSAKELADLLEDKASFLKHLVACEHPTFGTTSEIFLAGELGSVQHYSVLLAASEFKNKKAYLKLLELVNLRTILYMFSKERTQLFDAMIPVWAHATYELGPDATEAQVIEVYNRVALPEKDRIERFKELKAKMEQWSYENAGDRKKMRAVLALLSADMNNEASKFVDIKDAMRSKKVKGVKTWTLEHILSQSRNADNPKLHSLGNLTLLAPEDNTSASNKSPEEKQSHYNQSELILTKTLSPQPLSGNVDRIVNDIYKTLKVNPSDWHVSNWDDKAIDNRFDFYTDYLEHLILSAAK
jgi:uncharacterized protein with ParB-like and HNH nuclease domain